MTARANKQKTFQERMAELAALVEELEQGDLDLEVAIQKYEEGRKLEKALLLELKGYEKRLDVLMRDDSGSDQVVPSDEKLLF
ncbi:MAG TPA: exodeoxyribonuclease VII small subunit [Planctomycetota bacterium]|nr:exodeoxyribonuclease VII small subunit [Planctomycetota bacterium]